MRPLKLYLAELDDEVYGRLVTALRSQRGEAAARALAAAGLGSPLPLDLDSTPRML